MGKTAFIIVFVGVEGIKGKGTIVPERLGCGQWIRPVSQLCFACSVNKIEKWGTGTWIMCNKTHYVRSTLKSVSQPSFQIISFKKIVLVRLAKLRFSPLAHSHEPLLRGECRFSKSQELASG